MHYGHITYNYHIRTLLRGRIKHKSIINNFFWESVAYSGGGGEDVASPPLYEFYWQVLSTLNLKKG